MKKIALLTLLSLTVANTMSIGYDLKEYTQYYNIKKSIFMLNKTGVDEKYYNYAYPLINDKEIKTLLKEKVLAENVDLRGIFYDKYSELDIDDLSILIERQRTVKGKYYELCAIKVGLLKSLDRNEEALKLQNRIFKEKEFNEVDYYYYRYLIELKNENYYEAVNYFELVYSLGYYEYQEKDAIYLLKNAVIDAKLNHPGLVSFYAKKGVNYVYQLRLNENIKYRVFFLENAE